MALQLFAFAFFLLTSGAYADSCVSKPCNSDYHVTSWNPVREGSQLIYYYQVQTDGCVGVVFTDVLVQTSLSCQNCAQISCYDSNWNVVRCNYPPQWETSDSFLISKGVSVTSGLKWTLPQSTVLRFSINVNPSTTTSAQGKIYTKGNSWTSCPVITPVCNCACPPCPGTCYRSSSQTYPSCTCNNCTACANGMYQVKACNATSNSVCANCTQCVTNTTYQVVPCTGTQNRQCAACTQCVTNMTYEVAPCNGTQNRQCATCTQCVAGQYQSVPCGTKNRICANCTQCVTNMTYEVVPCAGVTNRQCANCTTCENGFFEVAPCNATHDRVCQRCSNCSANEEVLFPCNATSDIVCVPCPNCANCSAIPNSHLADNGLSCACNDGYSQIQSDSGPVCVETPCCGDCQSCGFNRSAVCLKADPTLCNYGCNYASVCTLGTTPQETGYTVVYNGMTVDAACCGAAGGECSCFSYQLSSSSFPLDDFVLGLNCPELQICSGLSTPPCLQTILRDGADGQVIFGIPGQPNPYTNVTGIDITGLNLNLDTTVLTFEFQGHINESSIPVTYSAGAQSTTSEDRTCLVSSTTGPACVDCSLNPTAVMAVKTLQMRGRKSNGQKVHA